MVAVERWRFIDTGSSDGFFNMALDEALLAGYESGFMPPVFRLYGWNPPAISLGKFQQAAGVVNLADCRADGIPVVKRITGGGAIFHDEEITYSFVCSDRLAGSVSVKESYKKIGAFLIAAYREMGIDVSFAGETSGGVKSDFCFGGREFYDILTDGRKIGGNAQKRKRKIIFQHGSIPLRLNTGRMKKYFKNDITAGYSAVPLRELKPRLSAGKIKKILKESFLKSQCVEFTESRVSAGEMETARKNARIKKKCFYTGEAG
ncbi:MAG: lipoate--protein ligase family protein [bacterium]